MPKKSTATLVLALLSAAAIFGLSFAGARMGAVSMEAAETEPVTVEDDTKSIAIPGYEAIPLKAGQNEQSVSFYNLKIALCIVLIVCIALTSTAYAANEAEATTRIIYTKEGESSGPLPLLLLPHPMRSIFRLRYHLGTVRK